MLTLSVLFILTLSGCGLASTSQDTQTTQTAPLSAEEEQLVGTWVETFPNGTSIGTTLYPDHTAEGEISTRGEDGLATPYQSYEEDSAWSYDSAQGILTITSSQGNTLARYTVDAKNVAVPILKNVENRDALVFKLGTD